MIMEYLWLILEQTQKLIYKNIDYRFINLRRSRTGIKVNTRRDNPLTNIKKYSFSSGQKSSDLLTEKSRKPFLIQTISFNTGYQFGLIPCKI